MELRKGSVLRTKRWRYQHLNRVNERRPPSHTTTQAKLNKTKQNIVSSHFSASCKVWSSVEVMFFALQRWRYHRLNHARSKKKQQTNQNKISSAHCLYRLAGVWSCVEILFFALQRWRYHRLNRVNERRPSISDIDARFAQFLTLKDVVDIREFISGWFLQIPFSEIRRLNVADFIAYAYWCAF